MGSISTLSTTSLMKLYHWAHYKRRQSFLREVALWKVRKYGEFGTPLRSLCATQVGIFDKVNAIELMYRYHNVLARGRQIWRRDHLNCKNSRIRRFWRHTVVVLRIVERQFSHYPYYCRRRRKARKIILPRLHSVLATGATVGSRKFWAKIQPHFSKLGVRRWLMLTAFVRRDLFHRTTPLATTYAKQDSKYKDFPEWV